MNNVTVVTAYTPLPVHHLTTGQYLELGDRLWEACQGQGVEFLSFLDDPIREMWSYPLCQQLSPANPVPLDRYRSPEINVMSNIVQHNRTAWALRAVEKRPNTDVVVWFDFGVMKQGAWNGKQLTAKHVQDFLRKVQTTPPEVFEREIPFPGITEKQTVFPTGNVWRFCGSTHIWPVKWLDQIDRAYHRELAFWVGQNKTCPLDLPIWALVEQHNPDVPFKWYPAEYDHTQLSNYPYGSAE